MRQYIVAVALLATFPASSATASSQACQLANVSYQQVLRDLSDALDRYSKCVEDMDVGESCSSEFRRLRDANDALESVIGRYRSECP